MHAAEIFAKFLSEIHILVFSAVFSNEFLHCSTCVVRAKPHVGLIVFDGLVQEV